MADDKQTLPEPPVPPELDLREFRFMKLNVVQLLNSDTWDEACEEPFAAAACMNLWMRAWHQVPAGSLPDNPNRIKKWMGIPSASDADAMRAHEIALRSFVKCSDGRLYHPVICDLAIDAWDKKSTRSDAAREAAKARWNKKKLKDAGAMQEQSDGNADAMPREGEGDREGEKKSNSASGADAGSKYAFEGRVIRLTRVDFERWEKRFYRIGDLMGQLESRDAYLSTLSREDQKKWFVTTSAWLANKNEQLAQAAKQKSPPRRGL